MYPLFWHLGMGCNLNKGPWSIRYFQTENSSKKLLIVVKAGNIIHQTMSIFSMCSLSWGQNWTVVNPMQTKKCKRAHFTFFTPKKWYKRFVLHFIETNLYWINE